MQTRDPLSLCYIQVRAGRQETKGEVKGSGHGSRGGAGDAWEAVDEVEDEQRSPGAAHGSGIGWLNLELVGPA